MRFAVITVGYNRPFALKRLLDSVLAANYLNDHVDLIISIDKGDLQDEIVKIADPIEWPHGKKIVRVFDERQGLRAHILQCGGLTQEYDAVIVLEDDLTVAEGFYAYAKQCIQFYEHDERIAGISLYKHRQNQGLGRPFDPAESIYDVFFMQIAQSWGQCWSRRMWNDFYNWYENNKNEIKDDEFLPAYVARWNKQSWLKYYSRYVAETKKFYVYPYCSLSTNHTEVGEHAIDYSNAYQVPLLEGVLLSYRLPTVEQGVCYDPFFERLGLDSLIFPEYKGRKMLDLMGGRTDFGNADYLISVQSLPFKVIKTIQLRYRPPEANCLKPVSGAGIYIYDLHIKAKPPKHSYNFCIKYDLKSTSWKYTVRHGLQGLLAAFSRRIENRSGFLHIKK